MSDERCLRAVIVEDEPLARANLREYAAEANWLTISGEASDGAQAVRLIDDLKPDLLFLDIYLPESSGLEVLKKIEHKPEIVFTTAHDEYAVAAFEIGALDYLLKPFGRQRFQLALERARSRLQSSVTAPDRAQEAFGKPLRRLFARVKGAIVPIDLSRVEHISACGDYIEVHCEGVRHLLHISLGRLVDRLDPEMFQQVHRSHVVNLDAVLKLVPFDSRRLVIHLRNGEQILASRSASEMLRTLAR